MMSALDTAAAAAAVIAIAIDGSIYDLSVEERIGGFIIGPLRSALISGPAPNEFSRQFFER